MIDAAIAQEKPHAGRMELSISTLRRAIGILVPLLLQQ
jgi:hypothetical protein